MDRREYRLRRSWVLTYQALGLVALGAAVLLLPVAAKQWPNPSGAFLGCVALGLAFWWLLGFKPSTYVVALADDGIRRPADGAWAPWSSLAGLSEQQVGQRVDILDRQGKRFASLHYRLDSFTEALERTVAGLRLSSQEDTFRRSLSSWKMLIGGAFVLGWVMIAADRERAVVLPVLLLVGIGHMLFFDIRSLTVGMDGLTVRYVLRSTHVPWSDVAAVHFALRSAGRGHRALDVGIVSPSGRSTRVRPHGADPFRLYATIDARLRARGHAR